MKAKAPGKARIKRHRTHDQRPRNGSIRRKTALIAAGVLLVTLAVLGILFLNPLRTLASFRKVDDFPLYSMRYYGRYDLGRYLQAVGQASETQSREQAGSAGWACTCFAALSDEGDPLFGRNFDWTTQSALLLFTDPPDGYASVTIVDTTYFGLGKEEPSWAGRIDLLATPYMPFDGMNEHGLAVGMMAVPHAEPSRAPQQTTITSLHVIRLMLDYARDVDEAISLLGDYNVDFMGGPPVHYLIADSSGDSAVIEFVGGQMHVIRDEQPWQVATNFLITEADAEDVGSSCWRYQAADEALQEAQGHVSPEDAMTLLRKVSQSSTRWSAVYDLTSGDIQVAMGRKYTEVNAFHLELKKE
jgi:hypothetical protein